MYRKKYRMDCKAKQALTAMKGQKTTDEGASDFGVHINQAKPRKQDTCNPINGSRSSQTFPKG